MKYFFLNILILISFVGQVFGSEKVLLNALISDHLEYFYVKNVQDFEKFNLEVKSNDPFLWIWLVPHENDQLCYGDLGIEGRFGCEAKYIEIGLIANDLLLSVSRIPLRYVLTDDANNFKCKGDTLFSFTREVTEKPFEFIIKLNSEFTNTPAEAIKRFRDWPKIHSIKDKQDKYEKDKEELIKQGVVAVIDDTSVLHCVNLCDGITHGPNSYFGDEVIKEREVKKQVFLEQEQKREEIRQSKRQSKLFYSRIKKFCGISITAILMYVLYQKFYTTVG